MKKSTIFYITVTILGIATAVLNDRGPLTGKLDMVGLALFTIVWAALAWQNIKSIGKITLLTVSYVFLVAIAI